MEMLVCRFCFILPTDYLHDGLFVNTQYDIGQVVSFPLAIFIHGELCTCSLVSSTTNWCQYQLIEITLATYLRPLVVFLQIEDAFEFVLLCSFTIGVNPWLVAIQFSLKSYSALHIRKVDDEHFMLFYGSIHMNNNIALILIKTYFDCLL
ncbi:hypothetical protein S83_010284 [Arachis hypogaea]